MPPGHPAPPSTPRRATLPGHSTCPRHPRHVTPRAPKSALDTATSKRSDLRAGLVTAHQCPRGTDFRGRHPAHMPFRLRPPGRHPARTPLAGHRRAPPCGGPYVGHSRHPAPLPAATVGAPLVGARRVHGTQHTNPPSTTGRAQDPPLRIGRSSTPNTSPPHPRFPHPDPPTLLPSPVRVVTLASHNATTPVGMLSSNAPATPAQGSSDV